MRRFALIALKFAISAVLLYFAFSRVSWQTVLERLHRLDWFYVTLALAIGILQIGAVAIRWRRIAQACGAALSTSLSMRFNLIGAFFGQVLPSTVGGDATRIWLVARIAGSGWRAATYSVLLDRFFGVFALAFVVTAGLYWSFALIQNPVGRLVLLAIGLGSLVGSATFLALGFWPWLARWKFTKPLSDMARIAGTLMISRDAGPMILSSSVLVHLMTAALAWSVAQAVAARLGYVDAVLLVLPVTLIATLPVSIAGWGVRETALMQAFLYAGLDRNDGLIVSVLLGLVTFATGIIGGLLWLAGSDRAKLGKAPLRMEG
jgi:uncharacterized membrane protein YbhN (UPF0104 family)